MQKQQQKENGMFFVLIKENKVLVDYLYSIDFHTIVQR